MRPVRGAVLLAGMCVLLFAAAGALAEGAAAAQAELASAAPPVKPGELPLSAQKLPGPAASGPPALPANGTVAAADNRFGFALLDSIVRANPVDNVFISPPSIALALTVAATGARGETHAEMMRCLELQGLTPEAVNAGNAALLRSLGNPGADIQLQVATSLWAEKRVKFEPAFLRQATESYAAQVTSLDFQDAATIRRLNAWVRDKTHGKIDDIVDHLSPDDVLVILNAIYFHADWQKRFDPKATRDKGFELADGKIEPCAMMSRSGSMPYFKGPNFQAVSLPYVGGLMSFDVILPDSTASLAAVVNGLDTAKWSEWVGKLTPSDGHLELPRFAISYDLQLNAVLQTLGMKRAFVDGVAEFGGMSNVPLFISEVRHKSRIEVTEEGTEAAAVTSVVMTKSALTVPAQPPFVMIVDRPFLCAIHDRSTGLVLFLGAILRPGHV